MDLGQLLVLGDLVFWIDSVKICTGELRLQVLAASRPALTPAAFSMASARSPSARPTYKAVVRPPLFPQLSSSFLLRLHFSDVLCLRVLASSILPCRPAAPQKDTTKPGSEKCLYVTAGCYSLEVSAALSRQLSDCGLPSVMTKDDADEVT